jgi:hypothetical protein
MSNENQPNSGSENPQSGPGNTFHQEVQHSPATARVPDQVGRGVFGTHAIVMQGTHEFLIDFIQSLAPPRRVVARVVLPVSVVPLFVGALQDNLHKYQNVFGPVPRLPPQPTQPGSSPPPQPPPISEVYEQLKLPDEMLGGVYANTVVISHSNAEFCFDFICNAFPRSVVTARVYLSAGHIQDVYDSLQRCLDQYRQKMNQPRNIAPPPPESDDDEEDDDDDSDDSFDDLDPERN